MLFDFKSAIILALVASISAAPTLTEENSSLEVRGGKTIKDVDCGGVKFTRADIQATKNEEHLQKGAYPKRYYNLDKPKIFGTPKELYEYPLTVPVYQKGKEPGKYRMVLDEDYNYQGTMYHVDGVSNAFKACT
ncbi:hypothetical protein ACHAO1_010383 [Botrytis cinerea]